MSEDDAKRAWFHEQASRHLKQIAAALTPDARLTLVSRFPGYEEREIVVTEDDLTEVMLVLARAVGRARAPR
jgi:hypothetical protein